MIGRLKDKARGARTRFAALFQPREPSIRTIRYRGVYIAAPIHTDVGWRLFRDRSYEDAELSALKRLVRDDDVVYDIGANIGIYSLILGKWAHKGRVVAVEPVPLNMAFLNLNLCLNSINNVRTENCIVTDEEKYVDFAVADDELYSSMIPTGRKATKERIQVRSTTLDALSEGGRVDVMKIDVEGAELIVLRGGERLLKSRERRPRTILIELNAENQAVYGDAPDDIVKYLTELGYSVHSFSNGRLTEGYTRDPLHEDVFFLDTQHRRAGV